ncbi:helix-turn-helix domain-containing protein [Pedobacter jamesrossensis]|uniref:Helix-turn-helix domain-containing protein n=1 Tax=Pedobacter jamesrossensis TaxID=1908238 RepID=A0ABV8NL95_9SPHI
METSEKNTRMHLGRKISRLRELRGMKQDTLALELGISQQSVSKLEQSEVIEDSTLEKIALVLGLPADSIRNFDEEKMIYNIQNNYENSNNTGANVGYQVTFNPLEKVIELYEENKKLYEKLLISEREKVEILKSKQ